MLILVDGYNVIAPAAPPGKNPASDWLHRERMRLIDRLATHLDPQLVAKTCVVFDATGRSRRDLGIDASAESTFRQSGIEVRFAVNHDEADDLIEELIALHTSPKRLTVVSSDHRLQVAARRSGATAFDSQPWLDALLDGKQLLAIAWPPIDRNALDLASHADLDGNSGKAGALDGTTVDQWLRAFEAGKKHEGNKRARVPKPGPDNGNGGSATPARRENPLPAKTNKVEQQSPPNPKNPGKPRKPPTHEPLSSSDPKRSIQGDNPFPEGYGEDLL